MGELPSGWAWARLGEISNITGGLTKNPGRAKLPDKMPFLRVGNVQAGYLNLSDMHETGVQPSELPRVSMSPGDLLIVEGNGSLDQIGRCAVWNGKIAPCVHQNHIIKARFAEDGLSEWVSLWLSCADGRKIVEAVASSTSGLHTLSISKISGLLVPVAPSGERQRIIACVQEQFADLDEAEAALARARAGLGEYRASLLHAACTGQLTAAWRASRPPPAEDGPALLRRILSERRAAWERAERARLHARGKPVPVGEGWKARYQEPVRPESNALPPLPSGWTWATLDQLTDFRGNGLSRRPANTPGGQPILRISAVRPMSVNTEVQRLYTPEVNEDVSGGTAQNGDLLFTRYSGSEHFVGVCGLLRGGGPILYPDKLMVARPQSGIEALGPLIELMAAAGSSKAHIAANIRTTAGQKGIAGSSVRVCPIPLPPSCEMRRLVGETTTLLEDVSIQEAVLVAASDQLATLRQSILHAAFTGRLVPQDPADEPAAALLARLRAAPAPPRRGRVKGRVPPPPTLDV